MVPDPARPLRILFVVNALEPDAPTSVTLALAIGLRKMGHQARLLAWSRGGSLVSQCEQNGVPCGTLDGRTFSHKALQLRSAIRTWQPAIVHSILARPTLGVAAARLTGLSRTFSWVIGDHGIHEWYERGRVIGHLMETVFPALCATADAITTVSSHARHQLVRHGINPKSVSVLPNAIDSTKFYPRSRAERCACTLQHFPDDDPWNVWPLLGSAGNLRVIKGHADILKAMPQVLQTWPAARLIIWGAGPEKPRLQTLAAELKISHAVSLPGVEPHLERQLPLLDLYIQPSLVESFGLAPAEAMACGIPAVVSDAGNLPELADHGRTAWIYPAGNASALASTILEALYNKQRLKKRGAEGRGFILQHYTLPQMIEKTADLYRQLDSAAP